MGEERCCVRSERLGWLHGGVSFVPMVGNGGDALPRTSTRHPALALGSAARLAGGLDEGCRVVRRCPARRATPGVVANRGLLRFNRRSEITPEGRVSVRKSAPGTLAGSCRTRLQPILPAGAWLPARGGAAAQQGESPPVSGHQGSAMYEFICEVIPCPTATLPMSAAACAVLVLGADLIRKSEVALERQEIIAMAFQTSITISDALERIHKRQYALPAIQREFVWSQEQICALFDSLMRGYPIGAFLFWEVKKKTLRRHNWYEFITRYHQRENPHCDELTIADRSRGISAVLTRALARFRPCRSHRRQNSG